MCAIESTHSVGKCKFELILAVTQEDVKYCSFDRWSVPRNYPGLYEVVLVSDKAKIKI